MLLFHGANIHHCTVEGRSGLHFACIYSKARTVKVIIKYLLETFATFRIQGLCNCDNDVGDDGYDDDDDDDGDDDYEDDGYDDDDDNDDDDDLSYDRTFHD
jgi:hypothetical protein